jgi:uncharacterized phage-associated protein
MNTSAIQVANYFVSKSLESGVVLTPMKLIKLVYIAHGWYLGLSDKPLLDEGAQAWKFGPVIETVYHNFKHYKSGQITRMAPTLNRLFSTENSASVEDIGIKQFLDSVWNSYSRFSGVQLSAMTHEVGTPWHTTWNENGGRDGKSVLIPNDLIKKHYKELHDRRASASSTN